jgi:hypothetical protein
MTANEVDGEFGQRIQTYAASWPELIGVTRINTRPGPYLPAEEWISAM